MTPGLIYSRAAAQRLEPIRNAFLKFLVGIFRVACSAPDITGHFTALRAVAKAVLGHAAMIYRAFLTIGTMKYLALTVIAACAHFSFKAIARRTIQAAYADILIHLCKPLQYLPVTPTPFQAQMCS